MILKKKKNLIISILLVFIFIFLICYLIRSWLNRELAKSYSSCKNIIAQQIYAEMNTYQKDKSGVITDPSAIFAFSGAKEKILDCTVNEILNKFSFLGKDVSDGIKANLKSELEI